MPLSCFGLEFSGDDARCQVCPHNLGCQAALGRRAKVIPLSKLTYSFVPDGLKGPETDEPFDVKYVYPQCHVTVFEDQPRDSINEDLERKIRGQAREAGLSIRMLILASMTAHKLSSPDRPFYARMLTGPAALKRAEVYREVCTKKYGTFDPLALEKLHQSKDTFRALLYSEVTVGLWMVGFKIRFPGPPVPEVYRQNELALDVRWLAIEPSYIGFLEAHRSDGSATEKNHRFNVMQTISRLKRQKTLAIATFKEREALMPEALSRVLAEYQLTPDDLETPFSVVTDSFWLWRRVALAIQQIYCLQFLDGGSNKLFPR